MKTVTKQFVKKLFPKRPDWSHKGDFGKLLIIGGSKTYSGSPALCGLAALRTGADIAIIAAPERSADIAASFSPDLITEPLEGEYFNHRHLRTVFELAERSDAVVIGGGLGRKRETMRAVLRFLKRIALPCVIDADALYALSDKDEIPEGGKTVLTPHTMEFFNLTKKPVGKEIIKRAELVEKDAKRLGAVILLKGHIDIISDGKKTMINRTGTPFLTKGGTGETITGICGALLARGVEPFEAACAAAYINGAAGELAARKFRQGMLASDILEKIPDIIK